MDTAGLKNDDEPRSAGGDGSHREWSIKKPERLRMSIQEEYNNDGAHVSFYAYVYTQLNI